MPTANIKAHPITHKSLDRVSFWICDPVAWAMDEFSGTALGDARLTKRLIRLVDDLSAQGRRCD